MKSILISIQPKWCELIASGKKTIEVRKTRPKLKTPFKCYIYCTKNEPLYRSGEKFVVKGWDDFGNGKVIGEFVCYKNTNLVHVGTLGNSKLELVIRNSDGSYSQIIDEWISKTCLSLKELENYSKGGDLYAWHISNLKIYDKPKELSEFYILCEESFTDKTTAKCKRCQYHRKESEMSLSNAQNCVCNGVKPITRPPQSWCYVEG